MPDDAFCQFDIVHYCPRHRAVFASDIEYKDKALLICADPVVIKGVAINLNTLRKLELDVILDPDRHACIAGTSRHPAQRLKECVLLNQDVRRNKTCNRRYRSAKRHILSP